MKIAFLTGGLEPGSDGVGDYSRIIAQELTRQGHECCLVALQDLSITSLQEGHAPADPQVPRPIPQLRLPAAMPWPERTERARAFLDGFAPDWVSLQFVPYSFEARGLVRGLAKYFRPLVAGRRFHLMCHELWIGEGQWPVKSKLVGIVQRRWVLQFIRALAPHVIHTSNAVFLEQLKRRGIRAGLLRIFGNIPVTDHVGDAWLLPQLHDLGLDISPAQRDEWWLFGFFGTVYAVWPSEPLFSTIKAAAGQRHRRVVILSGGRLGHQEVWDGLAQRYPEFSFAALGKLPGERISEYFNSLDFGIAASAYAFIGKSGSAIAMLEHGLPLIVNRDDWALPGGFSPAVETLHRQQEASTPNFVKMGDDFESRLVAGLPRLPPRSFLPAVAAQMIGDLEASMKQALAP